MSPTPTCGRRSGERGAAAVELALVLPILLMLIFGIIQFGRGYNAKITLTSAAREGARSVALGGDGVTSAQLSVPSGFRSAMTVSVSGSCPAQPGPDDFVTVETRYPFSYEIPFVGSGSRTLSGEASMRCGG